MTSRFPLYTVCSLLSAAVLGIASIPIWRMVIEHQVANSSEPGYSPDPGQFGYLGVIVGVTLTTLTGAVLGVVFAIVAHLRQETFLLFRALTLLGNLVLVGFGLYSLYPFRPR